MWRGFEPTLGLYGHVICAEWIRRGYRDTCTEKIALLTPAGPLVPPPWLGDPDFHLSHRSNLIRKQPDHYGFYWPGVADNLPYIWPV